MKKLLYLLTFFFPIALAAQTGYKIEFKVEGLRDTTVYLGYYQGEQTYVTDTARVDSKGYCFFDGKKALPEGAYFFAIGTALQFQMVIGKDQQFLLSTKRADYIGTMSVTGDPDNTQFFANLRFNSERYKEAEPHIKLLRDSTATEQQKEEARLKYQEIFAKVRVFQDQVIDQHPDLVSSRWLKANKEIDVPKPPMLANGKMDSTFQYRYYRAHYFDFFDVGDAALTRLPQGIYGKKVKDYFDRLIVPHPDSVYKEFNRLASRAKATDETYKWFVWTCFTHFQNHPIMGLDEVALRIFDDYIRTGKMDFWLDKKMKQTVVDHMTKVRLSMIGMTAPNLIMQDINLKPRALYDLKNKFTIVFFFRPTCGHCREETPLLVDFYNKNKSKFDLEIFAVNTDTSLKEMKKFMEEMKTPWVTVSGARSYVGRWDKLYYAETTPTIYILDEKKKIIGKRLGIDQFEDFLTRQAKLNKTGP